MEATLKDANDPSTELDDEYEYIDTYVNFDCDGFKEMAGRVYAFINIESGHIICIPIPHFGVGILLGFDVNDPTYLQGVVVLDFIKKLRLGAEFGDKCGTPCSEAPID
jgi:hypothetical protein